MAQRVAGTGRRQRLGARAQRLLQPLATAAIKAASRRTMPHLRGTVRLPGVAGPVVVDYDDYGVPHIQARSDADAIRVHGFCQTLDRFFQMDMLRRVLRGRLSEVAGVRALGAAALPPFDSKRTTVDADHLMRALDLLPSAVRMWDRGEAEGGEGPELMYAYVEGINACLSGVLQRKRPLEHRLMGMPLTPWNVADTVLIAKGLALGLSFKWRTAPVYAALAEHLSGDPRYLETILPDVPAGAAFGHTRAVAEGIGELLRFLPVLTPPRGSNAFVVGGGRTASGFPMIASDPHLDLSVPSVWHLASIQGSTYRTVGAGLPGVPGIVLGRNEHVAWGVTNGMVDDADLWVEEIDATGKRYLVDGAWRPLDVESQTIYRKGAAPLSIRVRRTHRGPIVSDAFPGYEGPPCSVRFTLYDATYDMEAFLGLGRSQDVVEASAAVEGYGAPVQNLLLADVHGGAAYRSMGNVPLRTFDQHPALPRDGRKSETDWTGFVPPEEVPNLVLGPDEHLVSANQPQAEGAYDRYVSHLYESVYRAERIQQLLTGRGDLTPADFVSIQTDVTDLAWRWVRALVLEPHAEAVRRTRPTVAPLLDRVLAWEGDERADAPGATPWHLVYHHLVRRTFGPKLGEERLLAWMGLMNLCDGALRRAFSEDDSPWAPPSTRAALLTQALEDATAHLRAEGLTMDAPWGAFHTLHLRHALGSVPLVGAAFNLPKTPVRGGPYTVCSGQYIHVKPGPQRVGASYRHVIDMAEPEAARMVTFTGQSGYVGSDNYADMFPLWLRGEGIPMRLTKLEHPKRTITFVPGGRVLRKAAR